MESYPYKNYKIVDADQLNADLTSVADAIRIKGKTTASLDFPDGFVGAIDNIKTGDDAPVAEKDVNFYDYDGTLLHAYTVADAQALTELPELPEREGLICQGWNWTLEDIKAHHRAVDVGATYTTDDGTTRLYIHLEEGRTSPMLGVCPNGTVTVDWGDGTEPDTLTGASTSTVQWTPNHEYAAPGDYVIKLTVDGEMGIRGYSGGSYILDGKVGTKDISTVYRSQIKRVEIGSGVTSFGDYAFYYCYSLNSIVIPNSVTNIGQWSFKNCSALRSVVIPNSVTTIYSESFASCSAMAFVVISNSIKSIPSALFQYSSGVRYFDFTNNTAVPTLPNINAFNNIVEDCEIRVPAALYDEWIAATNWATYADKIVAV